MATVLIVDDDKYTRTVLEQLLLQDPTVAEHDPTVVQAGDGEEGLAAYRKFSPEVVITDILMPKIDGYVLCGRIRALPGGAATPLVVMSGIFRDAAVARRVRSEFAAEFFAKPYELQDLTQHVGRLLASAAEPGAPASRPRATTASSAAAAEGDLAERPLPAVLFDLLEAKATGRLTLRRGRVVKDIDLVVGHPTSVASSRRDEGLGAFLVAAGAIADAQLKQAVAAAASHRSKIEQALIATGAITPEDLVQRLTQHTAYVLTRSLRWPDGAWVFTPGSDTPVGTRGHPIDVQQLVLDGLRQYAARHKLPPRVAALGDRPLSLSERGRRLLSAVRHILSDRFADSWRDGVTVDGLIRAGVERGEVHTTLDVLLSCDGLVVDEPEALSAREAISDPGDFSVEELSEHSQFSRMADRQTDSDGLYSLLFDETTRFDTSITGSFPIVVDTDVFAADYGGDSGVIDIAGMQQLAEASSGPRRMLLKEYLRIQGVDYYEVLVVSPEAGAEEIESAVEQRRTKFAIDWFSQYDLGRDYAKLEEVHAAYQRAVDVLLDPDKRAAYDRHISSVTPNSPTLDAEIAFRAGEDLLVSGHHEAAIAKLQDAAVAAPDEADYHALLGWAYYIKGGGDASAADAARPHLNQALSIDADHAAAHEYKGRITAALGNDDDEAIFHLERALDLDPQRADALAALERVWSGRGELRPLERQYRRLIYSAAGNDARRELALWVKLAELYRTELDDLENARIAYKTAARLAPDDRALTAALADIEGGDPDRFQERAESLRRAWRLSPTTADPGLALMNAALAADQHDVAFLTASALVARGLADADADALYQRFRPRFLIRAQQAIDADAWRILRHDRDREDLGELFRLLTPIIEACFPMTFGDLEIDESMEIDEADLPEAFCKVRDYVAYMLGVEAPRVYLRPDFGDQIHIGASAPRVLLVGDEALTSPERAELSFRLGRAMSYLWPGRAAAGSRPSRFLKAVVLGAFSSAFPDISAEHGEQGAQINQIRDRVDSLETRTRDRVHALVKQITLQSATLNLSRWSRALARTGDRVGLLLCGDVPAAARFARDSGGPSNAEASLLDFAVSSAFVQLRRYVGLSIDV